MPDPRDEFTKPNLNQGLGALMKNFTASRQTNVVNAQNRRKLDIAQQQTDQSDPNRPINNRDLLGLAGKIFASQQQQDLMNTIQAQAAGVAYEPKQRSIGELATLIKSLQGMFNDTGGNLATADPNSGSGGGVNASPAQPVNTPAQPTTQSNLDMFLQDSASGTTPAQPTTPSAPIPQGGGTPAPTITPTAVSRSGAYSHLYTKRAR